MIEGCSVGSLASSFFLNNLVRKKIEYLHQWSNRKIHLLSQCRLSALHRVFQRLLNPSWSYIFIQRWCTVTHSSGKKFSDTSCICYVLHCAMNRKPTCSLFVPSTSHLDVFAPRDTTQDCQELQEFSFCMLRY